MDNFYITLISNNSSNLSNQPASFRTYLPYTLQMEGQWECCLSELSFMKSWNNIDDLTDEKATSIFGDPNIKQTTFQFWLNIDEKLAELKKFPIYESWNSWQTLDVSTGYYSTVEDLINNFTFNFDKWTIGFKEKLEKEIKDKENMLKLVDKYNDTEERYELLESIKITIHKLKGYRDNLNTNSAKMSYDNVRKRINITFNKALIRGFRFSSHLNYMLGFKDGLGRAVKYTDELVNGNYIAEYPVNFAAGANSLFVYTDVIQPNIVSNKMARLLRIVNGTGEYGTYISKAYIKPYYMPVTANSINSIEIEIKDEMDRHIRFSFGITIARLHFQRKRPMFPSIT